MSTPLITFNEGETGYITVDYRSKLNVPTAPSSARCRIDCATNNALVRDWTTILNPLAVDEIIITSADNSIIDNSKATETKLLTIEATYGAGDKLTGQVSYDVKNLSNYP